MNRSAAVTGVGVLLRQHFRHLTRYLLVPILLLLLIASDLVAAASPRINFLLYCSGCHRPSGEGKPPHVPTLHHELGRMLSVPQMREYLVRIPGATQAPINDAELTGVINWVLEEFNAETLPPDFEYLSVEEVTAARKNILADPLKYRTRYWKAYPN
ncbi:MAG: cytochrome c [Proteobacteria bacterium]|nr:cytochrome c [Pseudomonadota bacterium]